MTFGSAHVFLVLAIIAEVIATMALSRVDGFTRMMPAIVAAGGYAVAFFFLSFPLRVMPTGVVYAIWSGVGIVFIVGIAWFWFGQRLDAPAIVGITFIVAGVLIVNLFSKAVVH